MRMKNLIIFSLVVGLTGCSHLNFSKPDKPAKPTTFYQVRKGDTLRKIAQIHQMEPEELIDLNELRPPYRLRRGDELLVYKIPGQSAVKPKPVKPTHTTSYAKLPAVAHAGPLALQDEPLSSAPSLGPSKEIALQGASSHGGAPLALQDDKQTTSTSPDKPKLAEETPPTKLGESAAADPKVQPESTEEPSNKAESTPKSEAVEKPSFQWPVTGKLLAKFGDKTGASQNQGINIAAAQGASVAAAQAGTVAYAGSQIKGYGNLVLIKHPGGWMTAYGHCDKVLVKKGDSVKQGQQIATVGKTGHVSETQLHFEVRQKTSSVDPLRYLK